MPAEFKESAANHLAPTVDLSALRRHRDHDRLVHDHLWLVDRLASQASRRFPRHVDRSELWSAGALGLVDAASRYEPNLNVPFAAYAAQRVRGEILETARTSDIAPRRLRRSLRELGEVIEGLTQTLARVPLLDEIAAEAGVDVATVSRRLQAAADLNATSLDDANSPAQQDSALAAHAVEPADRLTDRELSGSLLEAVSELPEPLRSIVTRCFWGNERLHDIAADMGVSFQRVAQYKAEAIAALSAWFAHLYDDVQPPEAAAPGSVRRSAFCQRLATQSTWRSRLDAAG